METTRARNSASTSRSSWIGLLPVCAALILAALAADAGVLSGTASGPGGPLADVAVYLDKIPGTDFAPPKQPMVLDQVNLTFVPHVLPVLAGTTVAFPNSDEVRHNVFSPSPAKRFNLGTYPRGISRSVTFDKPGQVTLLCNVHAEMSAFVIVVETPYHAVTGKDGRFTIRNIPPGKYTVKTWHEEYKPVAAQVEIKGEEAVPLKIVLK